MRITLASAALAAVSFGVWDVLDGALGRGLLGQIVSLGAASALGGLVYVGAAKLLRIAELEQVMRAAAPRLTDARPRRATCWASPRSPCSSASPRSAAPRCARACCPSFAGAPAHLATAVLALALLIWVAEILGTFGLFEPVPYLARRRGCGRLGMRSSCPRVARGWGVAGRLAPAAPPVRAEDRTRRPGPATLLEP